MGQLRLDVALAVAVWVETLLYGIYLCLFFETVFIMVRKRGEMLPSAKFFLVIVILMFTIATLHLAVGLYRFLRAFILRVDPAGPIHYYMMFPRWDNMVTLTTPVIMVWLGDILVIYRCYLIWNRKIWVIVIPVCLLLFSIGTNAALLFWFNHPFRPGSIRNAFHWLGTIYPISFVQNTFTTGMIALKIWRQHRVSVSSGVMNVSPLSLIGIFRIIVESAAIYTLQQLILVILYPTGNNAQFIINGTVTPSIGIVFALIAVRVHFSTSRTLLARSVVVQSMSGWLANDAIVDAEGTQGFQESTDASVNELSERTRSTERKRSLDPASIPASVNGTVALPPSTKKVSA